MSRLRSWCFDAQLSYKLLVCESFPPFVCEQVIETQPTWLFLKDLCYSATNRPASNMWIALNGNTWWHLFLSRRDKNRYKTSQRYIPPILIELLLVSRVRKKRMSLSLFVYFVRIAACILDWTEWLRVCTRLYLAVSANVSISTQKRTINDKFQILCFCWSTICKAGLFDSVHTFSSLW